MTPRPPAPLHVCTLFEGGYHLGLGALVNSLVARGYRGPVWAGYRGALPPWARAAEVAPGHARMAVGAGVSIEFIRVDTASHFTNHKPDFMLEVLRRAPEAGGVAYIDPDIVLKCEWSFIETWTTLGIALCEDVNSPMAARHPMRLLWRRFFEARGHAGAPADVDAYFNAGFVGVRREFAPFLEEWRAILALVGAEIGGLTRLKVGDPAHPFDTPDQDALNVAVMYTHAPVSAMGRAAMDFIPGGWTMAHAIGRPKPWEKSLVWQALRGRRPSSADRQYYAHIAAPIALYSRLGIARKRAALLVAAALGRYLGS